MTPIESAICEISLLFEQSLQLSGNHLHHSTIRPQLELIRKSLGYIPPNTPGMPPSVTHTSQMAQVHHPLHSAAMGMMPMAPAQAVEPMSQGKPPQVAEGTDEEKMAGAKSLAALYNIPEDAPGCATCGRKPLELLAHGHGPGCAAASAAVSA